MKVIDLEQLIPLLDAVFAPCGEALFQGGHLSGGQGLGRPQGDDDEQQAGEEVHHRARRRNGKPAGQTGRLEGAGLIFHFVALFVKLPFHHDASTQRQKADGIKGAFPLLFHDGRAETDGKPVNGDPGELGGHKVPQLMDKHDQTKYQNRDENGQKISPVLFLMSEN